MTLSVSGVQALTVKGIDTKGGVKDAIFKNNAYLSRLKEKQRPYSGEKHTSPFNYLSSTSTTGSFYSGAQALSLDMYDPYTELSWDLVEQEESLVITHLDLAKNSGKEARLKLVEQRLKTMEQAFRERLTKSIFSDGTAATGALTTDQHDGIQTFLKSSAVNYGNVTSTDVSVHVAYVADNGGTNRSLTTALVHGAIEGSSEGQERPSLGIMRGSVMTQFLELLKPYQRTTRESTLNGLGHSDLNALVYCGQDFIVDNLAPANSIVFLNEKFVELFVHPEYDMKRVQKSDLETMDAMLQRLFMKSVYACSVLRYQGWLKDITA